MSTETPVVRILVSGYPSALARGHRCADPQRADMQLVAKLERPRSHDQFRKVQLMYTDDCRCPT